VGRRCPCFLDNVTASDAGASTAHALFARAWARVRATPRLLRKRTDTAVSPALHRIHSKRRSGRMMRRAPSADVALQAVHESTPPAGVDVRTIPQRLGKKKGTTRT